jgi:hypothetical protein
MMDLLVLFGLSRVDYRSHIRLELQNEVGPASTRFSYQIEDMYCEVCFALFIYRWYIQLSVVV